MRWTAGGEVWVQDLCRLLCCVLGQKHFTMDHRALENCQGSRTKLLGGQPCDELASHPGNLGLAPPGWATRLKFRLTNT